jgi:hypothetical protein
VAVPTIVSIDPARGLAMGDSLVAVTGTNFRPATLPPSGTITNGVLPQSIQILFDGVPGTDARCFTDTFATVLAPPHVPGDVDVTVVNLDQDTGEAIGGETATLPASYSYLIPIHTADYESDLTRLVRTLLQLMKAELLAKDITYAVQTDYVDAETDDVELHVTKFAELPGISIVGPELVENRFFSLNEEPTIEDPATVDDDGNAVDFVRVRVPYTVDVMFTIVGVTTTKNELLNLMSNFVSFMHKNKKLAMNKSASDPSKGVVKYEMDFQDRGQPKARSLNVGVETASNLRVFDASIVVRGFDIETASGIDAGTTAGVPNQAVVERGKTIDGEVNFDTF